MKLTKTQLKKLIKEQLRTMSSLIETDEITKVVSLLDKLQTDIGQLFLKGKILSKNLDDQELNIIGQNITDTSNKMIKHLMRLRKIISTMRNPREEMQQEVLSWKEHQRQSRERLEKQAEKEHLEDLDDGHMSPEEKRWREEQEELDMLGKDGDEDDYLSPDNPELSDLSREDLKKELKIRRELMDIFKK